MLINIIVKLILETGAINVIYMFAVDYTVYIFVSIIYLNMFCFPGSTFEVGPIKLHL